MKICPTLASAAGLLGGYKVASTTGNRPLGGAVLGLAGFIAFKNWKRKAGVGRATFLTGVTFLPSVTPIRSPRKLARGRQSIP